MYYACICSIIAVYMCSIICGSIAGTSFASSLASLDDRRAQPKSNSYLTAKSVGVALWVVGVVFFLTGDLMVIFLGFIGLFIVICFGF